MNTIGSVIVLFLIAGFSLIFWIVVLGAAVQMEKDRPFTWKARAPLSLRQKVTSTILEVTAALLTVAPLVVLLVMAAKAALA